MNTLKVQGFKINKKIIIGFILMVIGIIMLISSFFIPDTLTCDSSIWNTFSSSLYIFGIGLVFLMIGLAITDVEYRKQTGWMRSPPK